MSTNEIDQWAQWRGHRVVDVEGTKVGKVDEIYVDEGTNRPEWVSVTTGLFGSKQTFVPLAGAAADGDSLRVQFTHDQVKGAPNIDPDGHLSAEDEESLYRHYRTGSDRSETTSDEGMTRSEERLHVELESHEVGRVRLRKWVDTEHVTQTVPVKRDYVTVEREPIGDADLDRESTGGEISEEVQEIVLTEERPVVTTETVPIERVRLHKESVIEEHEVGGDVRKERIEPEGEGDSPAPRPA